MIRRRWAKAKQGGSITFKQGGGLTWVLEWQEMTENDKSKGGGLLWVWEWQKQGRGLTCDLKWQEQGRGLGLGN